MTDDNCPKCGLVVPNKDRLRVDTWAADEYDGWHWVNGSLCRQRQLAAMTLRAEKAEAENVRLRGIVKKLPAIPYIQRLIAEAAKAKETQP